MTERQLRACKSLLKAIKSRAKTLKVPFDMTHEDIYSLDQEQCPLSGVALVKIWNKRTLANQDRWASLDRVIPTLGYVAGNVRFVSFKENRRKGDLTLEDLTKLQRYIVSHTLRNMNNDKAPT